MADITAIILTRNEEDYIGDCIRSIRHIVKRIVVVDSFSEDRTVEIASSMGAEVHQHEFVNHAKQYMYAVGLAQVQTTWILRIDADERLTEESADELEQLCSENEHTDVNGIVLRFYNLFLGKPMRHGGMYPWRKLSVYKTGKGNIEDRNMDEHIILDSGITVQAKKDSVHLAFRGLTFFTNKCNWYSTREAMDYFECRDVRNASLKTRLKMNVYYKLPLGFRSWAYYVYRYYVRLGFLDGKEGKIFAFLHAYWYRFLVDAKIYEHEKLGGEFKPTGALK
ncbi:MAG: glycosyltransferase family 2 protein [Butyricicoccaceae bacterium]